MRSNGQYVKRLQANGCWAVVYGDSMVRPAPDLPMFWSRRCDLVSALNAIRINVERNGLLTSMNGESK